MRHPHHRHTIDLQEVRTRNLTAREIVSSFSEAMPSVAELWFRINAALADTPGLVSELDRLRHDRANLAAAARAALSADQDGEHDPFYYLRDELRAQGFQGSDDEERP